MRTMRFWRPALAAILIAVLLAMPACGKKGDPVPPEKPKAKTMFNTAEHCG